MTTNRAHFDQHQPGIVTGYMRTDEMNVRDLEAKCREAHPCTAFVEAPPALILQLIEERRILAKLSHHWWALNKEEHRAALNLEGRVMQEISECKS